MPLDSKKSRVILFFAIGLGLSLVMAGLKALLAWATDTYLYSVPWVGGFLRSIELAELSNLLVFAILGVGIGSATVLLPHRWDHRAKLAVLFVVSPFVFCASYMMQQHLWVRQVASTSNISYREAKTLTNDYLERKAGSGGFWGYYPYSTQLADLPTRRESLVAEQALNPNELLSQELSGYDDPRADFAVFLFERVGWLIRLMYMAIAAFTGLIYYFKGHVWAEHRRLMNASPAAVSAPEGPAARGGASKKTVPRKTAQKATPKGPAPKGATPKRSSANPVTRPLSRPVNPPAPAASQQPTGAKNGDVPPTDYRPPSPPSGKTSSTPPGPPSAQPSIPSSTSPPSTPSPSTSPSIDPKDPTTP